MPHSRRCQYGALSSFDRQKNRRQDTGIQPTPPRQDLVQTFRELTYRNKFHGNILGIASNETTLTDGNRQLYTDIRNTMEDHSRQIAVVSTHATHFSMNISALLNKGYFTKK